MKPNVDLTDNRDFHEANNFIVNSFGHNDFSDIVVTSSIETIKFRNHNTGSIILTGNATERLLKIELSTLDRSNYSDYICDCCGETIPWKFTACETLCDKCNNDLHERCDTLWWKRKKPLLINLTNNTFSVVDTTLSTWTSLNEDEILLNTVEHDSDL